MALSFITKTFASPVFGSTSLVKSMTHTELVSGTGDGTLLVDVMGRIAPVGAVASVDNQYVPYHDDAKPYRVMMGVEFMYRKDPNTQTLDDGASRGVSFELYVTDVRSRQIGATMLLDQPGVYIVRAGVPNTSITNQGIIGGAYQTGTLMGQQTIPVAVQDITEFAESSASPYLEHPWYGSPANYTDALLGDSDDFNAFAWRWAAPQIEHPIPVMDSESVIYTIRGVGPLSMIVSRISWYEADSPEALSRLIELPLGRTASEVPGTEVTGASYLYRYQPPEME